jgi:flagellar hook protein FlgE
MNISLNTAAQGMQVPLMRQDVTANNIANVNTSGYEQMTARQTDVAPAGARISTITRTPNPNPDLSGTDLAGQTTNMMVDKNIFTANAKVFKAQDKMIGEAIDLLA